MSRTIRTFIFMATWRFSEFADEAARARCESGGSCSNCAKRVMQQREIAEGEGPTDAADGAPPIDGVFEVLAPRREDEGEEERESAGEKGKWRGTGTRHQVLGTTVGRRGMCSTGLQSQDRGTRKEKQCRDEDEHGEKEDEVSRVGLRAKAEDGGEEATEFGGDEEW